METLASNNGLSIRVKLEQIGKNHLGIVKRIKSRIIKKDAQKNIQMANAIREKGANLKVSLICNDNICSKSLVLLSENNIEVVY